MAGLQAVWGIDIGRCALKAVKLRLGSEGKVELLAFEYLEHAKILSQPDADRPALVAAALEKFLARNDITRDQVVVGVPGQHTLARFTKLPPVQPKKIPDIVRYEAEQQIPFDMDEVIWDYQTFQREDFPDVEVGIFAMKRELIREHLLYFEQAAIEPIAVQSGPLATFNAVVFDDLLGEDTTAIIDLGAENTDLILATRDTLWTRTIPIGGNNFTEAMVKFFKLSFARAENLKRSAGTSKYGRQIFQAMRPVFADLVQELQRSIGFYLSTHRDAEISKVVGLGNGVTLPGLQKYLQQNLGMEVHTPGAFSKLVTTGAPEPEKFTAQLPSFAVAYGLALQGLDQAKVTSNLLPIEIAKQVVWRKKRPGFAAAAACLVLAGGIVWFRQTTDMSALAASSEGADMVSIASVEEATSIIENGPPSGLSARAEAKTIYETGQQLQRELQNLDGQGEPERKAAQELIDLQQNKILITQLLGVIHAAVPKPEGALADATTPQAWAQAWAADETPRDQRNFVFLKSLDIRYYADTHWGGDWAINITSSTDAVYPFDPETADAPSLPGLVCEVTCSTPNQGGSRFIENVFMERLRQVGRQPGMGFFINRVHLLEARRAEIGGGLGSSGTSMAFMGSKPGLSASAPVNAASLDPITNDSMEDDWEFDIIFDVIFEDYPEAESEEEYEEEAGEQP